MQGNLGGLPVYQSFRSIIAAGLFAVVASRSLAQYTYTTIDAPGAAPDQVIGGAYGGTYPLSINNSGEIVGYYVDSTNGHHGFVYINGSFTTIDYTGCANASGTVFRGVNNSGEIVGHCGVSEGLSFVYQNGTFAVINPGPNLSIFEASGVNDSGQIVGLGLIAGTANAGGYVYSNGSFAALNMYWPLAINSAGEIGGYYDNSGIFTGALFSGGVYSGIPNSELVSSINSFGQIIGLYSSGGSFLYDSGNFTTLIDPAGTQGAGSTMANGINDLGVIVGSLWDPAYGYHGFIAVPNTPSASITLSATSNGSAVSTVGSGSVVKLTASATYGGAPVTAAQVNFCDASPYCTDIHLIGTAQVTGGGTATLALRPGVGSHFYRAVLLPSGGRGPLTSVTVPLTVTGTHPTTTVLGETGSVGNYTLSATVTGNGGIAPLTGTVSFLDGSNSNAALGSVAVSGTTQTLSLLSPQVLSTSQNPNAVVVGDFNGDGILDVASADGNYFDNLPGDVAIWLGNGDGTFTEGVTVTTGTQLRSLAVGDFNGDGRLDLAVPDGGSSAVDIWLGNGDGTFAAASASPATGLYPSAVAIADFNGDGVQDLVVAGYFGTVTILLGNGDGTFTPTATSPATGTDPLSIAVGDLNGDGRPDLAIAYDNGGNVASITILLGNGDGTFSVAPSVPSGSGPNSVVAADFNGDGKLDLAVGYGQQLNVDIALGNGDGTFSPVTTMSLNGNALWMAVGDFNLDGKADLAVGSSGVNTVNVLTGRGDGTFAIAASAPYIQVALGPVAVADFNGDGVPDIVQGNANASGATVLLSQLNQTATATASGVSVTGAGSHQVDASYSGDSNYAESVSGPVSLTGPSIPALGWPTPAAVVYGTALSATQLNATASIPGTFVYTPPAGTVLPVGTSTLSVVFTPTDLIDYTSATASVQITVNPSANSYDAATSFEAGWIAQTNPNGVWSYGWSTGFTAPITRYDQTVQNGVNGPTAQYWLSSTVNSATSPAAEYNNGPAFDNGNVNFLANQFVLVAGVGGQYSNLIFTAPSTGTYFLTSSFRGDQYGIGTAVAVVQNGTVLFNSTVTTEGQVVPFNTSLSLNAGDRVVFSVGPNGGAQNTGVSATFQLTSKFLPTITWPSPSPITYGTALGAAQLNATSSVPGAFVYSPPAGTVLAAGVNTLSVTFTPTDTNTYATVTSTVQITVNQAIPTLTVGPGSLAFTATSGGSNPASQPITIANSGGGSLNWTASNTQAWLSVDTGSGAAPATINVAINVAGLPPGTYQDNIIVTAAGASGSPAMIPVTLTLTTPPTSSFPGSVTTATSDEFSLVQGTQGTQSIQLTNTAMVAHSATLTFVNPKANPSLSVPRANPISVPAGQSVNVPISIDGSSTPVGTYDGILLKISVDDGTTLYANITVNVVQQNLPDLAVSASDILPAVVNADSTVTLTADIHNLGPLQASNVTVSFSDFGSPLGNTVVTQVAAGMTGAASITVPLAAGNHLIQVVVDPNNAIQEIRRD